MENQGLHICTIQKPYINIYIHTYYTHVHVCIAENPRGDEGVMDVEKRLQSHQDRFYNTFLFVCIHIRGRLGRLLYECRQIHKLY